MLCLLLTTISCSTHDNTSLGNNSKENSILCAVKIISTAPLVIESKLYDVVKALNTDTNQYTEIIIKKMYRQSLLNPSSRKKFPSRAGYKLQQKYNGGCWIYGYYDIHNNFTPASPATQVLNKKCFGGLYAK